MPKFHPPQPPKRPKVNHELIINLFSQSRFKKYLDTVSFRQSKPDFSKAIQLYAINILYCESLYPILQCYEIALRNSIDKSLKEIYDEYWFIPGKYFLKKQRIEINDFDNENYLLLDHETDSVIQAIRSTIKDLNNRPLDLRKDRDKILANLTLGFWTALITNHRMSSSHYHNMIFTPCIKKIFPEANKPNERSTKNIRQILDGVRRLRNRVFHHEPIIWDDNLYTKYENISKVLNWIDPNIYSWMRLPEVIDRFPDVYKRYSEKIQRLQKNKIHFSSDFFNQNYNR